MMIMVAKRLLTQVVFVAGTAAIAITAHLSIGALASIVLSDVDPLEDSYEPVI